MADEIKLLVRQRQRDGAECTPAVLYCPSDILAFVEKHTMGSRQSVLEALLELALESKREIKVPEARSFGKRQAISTRFPVALIEQVKKRLPQVTSKMHSINCLLHYGIDAVNRSSKQITR